MGLFLPRGQATVVKFHGKMEKEHFTSKSQTKLSTWSVPC